MLKIDAGTVEWRLVEGEIVALDVGRGEYLAVNATGAKLWSMLAEGTTETDLVDTLATDHRLTDGAATADVVAFLAVLRERGLLLPTG